MGISRHASGSAPAKAAVRGDVAIAYGLLKGCRLGLLSCRDQAMAAVKGVAGMIGPLTMMTTGLVIGGMTVKKLFAQRRVFGVIFFRMVFASGLAVLVAALATSKPSIPALASLCFMTNSAMGLRQMFP